ncbi:MAG: hypothetical protein K2H01_03015 [Ruminococcus sp.]|nr:hypothetical protein [Ruminococcus sp.]
MAHNNFYSAFIDEEKINKEKELIKQMCAEMYEAGIVDKATYSKIWYDCWGTLLDMSKFKVTDPTITEEELSAVVKNVSEEFTVSFDSEANNYLCTNTTYTYSDDDDTYAYFDVASAIKKAFPNAIVDVLGAYDPENSSAGAGNSFNLLDPYICDIDGSGKADITDATAILTAYAENAAGLQKADADDKMDVNGDGEVNIEDATYVLTYYAEAAAGIR